MPVGTFSGTAYNGVTGMVVAGMGTITSGIPAWNGNGIVTSQPAASTSILTTLAVAAASDVKNISGAQTALFGGMTVTPTDTLVMYTYGGDANLDGKIDADDYFQIDSHYNKSGSSFGYFNGDFNYDGKINGDDYFIIDSNFTNQGLAFPSGSAFNGSGGASLSGGVAAVPEPASLASCVVAAAMLASRRKRRAR